MNLITLNMATQWFIRWWPYLEAPTGWGGGGGGLPLVSSGNLHATPFYTPNLQVQPRDSNSTHWQIIFQ